MNVLADLHRKSIERTYEYAIAEVDEYGDTQDYAFTDTYHEALGCAALIDGNSMIELWVNFGNDDSGLIKRDTYEIVHGALQGEYPKHVEKHFEKTRT
tara:strand:- start:45 stop:338 length:294 start_codon:yes stop_codon:yes gene_type:complete